MSKPENPHAFPMAAATAHSGQYGMSLRDWFAGQALSGLASRGMLTEEERATEAYRFADAMLAARATGGE